MVVVVRHGEIFTKSEAVRKRFVDLLAGNIRKALPKHSLKVKRWRILVYGDEELAAERLRKVFGVKNFSRAVECKADLNEAKKAIDLSRVESPFRVSAQRITKDFPMTSQEIEKNIGSFIVKETGASVDLKNPKTVVFVEVYDDKAFVFFEKEEGPGGLPLGSAGGVLKAEYVNDFDVLAAWMMMKRGALVKPVHEKLREWSNASVDFNNIMGEVTGTLNAEEFVVMQGKRELPLFAPLIGFSEEEARNFYKRVFS